MVLELFGRSLHSLIFDRKKFNLTEEHIKVIAYNLLCAANFIHSAKIVHRDFKPANVLIDMECNIKLCDFGLARTIADGMKDKVKDDKPRQKKERAKSPGVGTRQYKAPEVIVGYPNYDYSVDIWSIGCIIGELVLRYVECRQPGFLFSGDSCYPHSKVEKSGSQTHGYSND